MKKILAVSGGVDSMVLLDYAQKIFDGSEIVVAHFDHGTRLSSKDDYEFVEQYCKKHGLVFVGQRGDLGDGVPEAVAREARYAFLHQVAKADGGEIFTAHHLDDLVETVVINFLRGTGWRGLAALNAPGISRPLIEWTKKDILRYAAEHGVSFRQDPTNTQDNYLRNRVRPLVRELNDETKRQILELWKKQIKVAAEVEKVVAELSPKDGMYEREWFMTMDDMVAHELLRPALHATRPKTQEFIEAIKTYAPGKYFNLPEGRLVKISKKTFVL